MILVMTASIKPAKVAQLCLTDAEERLEQYRLALGFYLQCKKFDKIVFCDNSNYPYEYEQELQIAKAKNIRLEILKFNSDYENVEKYGKGYGEGEILKYVIFNSCLIKEEGYFYKVTGRLIIKNISYIIKKDEGAALFNRNLYSYKSFDTRFWGIKKEDFINYLMEAYKKVNDNQGNYIEMVYKKELEKAKIKYKSFCAFPIVDGYSGTIGKKYRETKWYTKIVYDFMCYFNLFNSAQGFCIAFVLYNVVMCKKEVVDTYYLYLMNNVD